MTAQSVPAFMKKRRLTGFLFFLPALIFLIVFLLGPILVAIWISFTKYTILAPPKYVGLKNYIRIFNMPSFWNSLRVTGIYIVYRVVGILVLAFFMASLINKKIRFAGFFQSVYFMPYVFPLAVTAIVWKIFYRPFGLFESIVGAFGIEGASSMLSSESTALTAVIITTVWSAVGYYSIILLAGLQTIPKEVLEASVIDGANRFQAFIHVILPLLKPTLFYIIVVATINSIRGFAPFIVMTQGGPGDATRVIGYMIYEYGFVRLRMGMGSAMSVILLILIFIFTAIQRKFFRYEN